MRALIRPGKARGVTQAPPSKSMAHRLLLGAGLASGTSAVQNVSLSGDISATLDCLRALGARVEPRGGDVVVAGCDPRARKNASELPCFESGSTLRFCIPLCLLSDAPAVLRGTRKLLSRPLSAYEALCRRQGIRFEQTETALTVQGRLQGGAIELPGGVSSQFATGLLYALPLLPSDSTITLIPPVESRPYLDLTLCALRSFGIDAFWRNETTLFVPGGQSYAPGVFTVEGDWSNAAYLEGLNLCGGDVTVTGLNPSSLQGDRVYRACFSALADGMPTLDLSDCPDLGPILFALAAANFGAVFTGVGRLRIKESDRVAAMQAELQKFGVRTEASETTLTVFPGLHAPTEPLFGHNDHRVVMALAALCVKTGGQIDGIRAVDKSFPDFFTKLTELNVEISYELDQQS